jgi:hypothetical protein
LSNRHVRLPLKIPGNLRYYSLQLHAPKSLHINPILHGLVHPNGAKPGFSLSFYEAEEILSVLKKKAKKHILE